MKDYNILQRISEDLGIENARKLYINDEYWRNIIQDSYGISNISFLIFKLGEHVMVDGVEGIVVSLYPNKLPSWIMLPKETDRGVTWGEALMIKLPDGWKIPSKEEFEEFGKNIANLQKFGNQEFSSHSLGEYLWSSTEYDNDFALALNVFYGCLDGNSKTDIYSYLRVRAFKKLENLA